MSTGVSAGLDDHLLFFNAMIPIDCKIAKFSLHLFFYFFVTIIIFGELTSATSNERNDHEYYFRGYHTH